jgi:hypothetical protein
MMMKFQEMTTWMSIGLVGEHLSFLMLCIVLRTTRSMQSGEAGDKSVDVVIGEQTRNA